MTLGFSTSISGCETSATTIGGSSTTLEFQTPVAECSFAQKQEHLW